MCTLHYNLCNLWTFVSTVVLDILCVAATSSSPSLLKSSVVSSLGGPSYGPRLRPEKQGACTSQSARLLAIVTRGDA
ncbi:hypothetical protein B0H14DRAFT_2995336, partial [Mycena olivaceomarginata]